MGYDNSRVQPVRSRFPAAFYIALFATTIFAMGLTITFPVIPLFITEELGAADRWIGTATLVVALIAVMLRLPSGAMSDRRGRRAMMLIGAASGVLAAALYVSSQSLALFLVARVFTGVSIALFTTANKALIADLAPPARRGEALGMGNASFSVAMVVSPLLGEGIKNAVSFQAVFALSGVLVFLALAISLTLPPDRPERGAGRSARGDFQSAMRERGMWSAMTITLGTGAVMVTMFTFYPLIAERKEFFANAPRLFSPIAIGLGLSLWASLDTAVEPIAGRISDRIGRQPVAIPGLAIIALGLVALSRASGTASAYLAIIVLATGWGMTRATADSIAQDALPSALRGTGAAALYTSFDLAVGIDAQALGALINGDDFSLFFGVAVTQALIFGVIGILLATRLVAYEKRIPSIAPGG